MNVVSANEIPSLSLVSDDLLRILVWVPDDPAALPGCYMRGVATDGYYSLEEDEKIRLEVSRWREALIAPFIDPSRGRALERLSPALFNVLQTKPSEARDLFARTARMLLLLEALFLKGEVSASNPYAAVGASAYSDLQSLVSGLSDGRSDFIEGIGGKWVVSLPLLLVVAVAESQCEWFRLFAWEAYSAGRVLDQYRDRWKRVASPKKDEVIHTLYYLIRCQSVIGQVYRKTSGLAPINLTCQNGDFAFEPAQLESALRFFAVVEEGRNHRVPHSCNGPAARYSAELDAFDLDSGIGSAHPWSTSDFLTRTRGYVAHKSDDVGPTWSFFGPRFFGLSSDEGGQNDDIEAFKSTVSEAAKSEFSDRYRAVANISVGREQTRGKLRPLLGEAVRGWNGLTTPAAKAQRFKQRFRLQLLQVPSPFSDGTQYCVQVLLQDRIAAQQLLFPGKQAELLNGLQEFCHQESANDLFEFLLRRASEEMKLEVDASWPEPKEENPELPRPFPALTSGWYVPVPLIHRITSVIHVLRPDACFQIPVQIDGLPTKWIYLPHGVRKNQALHVRILANFVLATVLNHAMAQGVEFAEVDLQYLVISEGAQTGSGNSAAGEELMQAADWRESILFLYRNGGYEGLLGRYLRDFNTRRENVRFDTQFAPNPQERPNPGRQEPLSIGSIKERLGVYLAGKHEADKKKRNAGTSLDQSVFTPELWLLGVDIGGTLTKCQMFRFTARDDGGVDNPGDSSKAPPFKQQGRVFKMSTAPSVNSKPRKDKPGTPIEALHDDTRNYAQRLLKLVKDWSGDKNNLDTDSRQRLLAALRTGRFVIGLSWPGPVRDNHVAGTSGILQYFGSLSRNIPDNKIDDIWEVDIASAVQEVWKREYGESPSVSLLNDGDAEAVGAVVQSPPSMGQDQSGHRRATLSVVKLGTGLAGALLSSSGVEDLALQTGLFEWGKLILDVAAPLRTGFPQGVAAEYLSKRCLPRLASSRGRKDRFFHQDMPDSAEIGLIFETARPILEGEAGKPRVASYKRLRVECGANLASRHSPWGGDPVSAEVLKTVYDKRNRDLDLLYAVQLATRQLFGAEETLRKDLENYGLIRIDRLIGLEEERLLKWMDDADAELATLSGLERFRAAGETAKGCIESLGRYLGDFCVLLYDQLGVDMVRLTGGVLGGDTGAVACQAAASRVGKYGLELRPSGNNREFVIRRRDDTASDGESASSAGQSEAEEIERGALGAASFAAASLLHSERQKGLQTMASWMLPLEAGRSVTISGSVMQISGGGEVDLGVYGLQEEDLLSFLHARGPAWGFYRFRDTSPYAFLRWVVN